MKKFHWQLAEVTSIREETPTVKTIKLRLPEWIPHLPGQHYDVRLTAEDGYQAQRSYSVASSPVEVGQIDLTIEKISDGEVSPYLFDFLAPGDMLEVRGPIGGYFVWTDEQKAQPLLLVGGGSGVVPLMAILRHRKAIGATNRTTLLFSVRTETDAVYRSELIELARQDPLFELLFTYTRQPPPDWTGYHRRIDAPMLTEIVSSFQPQAPPLCFVCGPTAMVEQVANALIDLGLPADTILTERFGPTGA